MYQIGSRVLAFEWHIYISPSFILKVKVKVTHISIANISLMVADRDLSTDF